MKVIQVMAGGAHGGAETVFVDLNLTFQEIDRIDQHLVIRREPARLRRLEAGGCRVTALGFRANWDLFTRLALKRLIAREQPQVVLTWMNRAAALCPTGPYVKAARLGGYYDLKYYRRHDHLIGIVPGIVDYLRRNGWPAERCHFIPNFCRVGPEPAEPRDRHSTPDDAPLLLFLGRLHRKKALDVLLAALERLPGCYLWVAGAGPEETALRALADTLGVAPRVRFLGWRADKTALLRTADLCVFPSRYEPHGNVVLDAWSHNVPLVAAAADGPRELIRDGIDGLVVPIDDAAALATACRRLLDAPDLAATLVAGGRHRVAATYSRDAVVGAYLDLFERVTRNGPPRRHA